MNMAGRTPPCSTSKGRLRQDDPPSAEAEPEIYATTKRFGTVLENVVIDPVTREIDLDDAAGGKQPRLLSDRLHPECLEETWAGAAELIFLTADAYGVLPPIARLTPDQAMYHFLSGYTARGGHRNRRDRTRSDLLDLLWRVHAAPPSVYGNLLKERTPRAA
jgi:phosphoenolpyruvate carboxykinase (ATP)